MLTCRDFTRQADQLLDSEAPWHRRLAFRIHLFLCADCRRYLRQLRALVRAVPSMHGDASDAEVECVMRHIHQNGAERPGSH